MLLERGIQVAWIVNYTLLYHIEEKNKENYNQWNIREDLLSSYCWPWLHDIQHSRFQYILFLFHWICLASALDVISYMYLFKMRFYKSVHVRPM